MALSPDLKLIENLWAILPCIVYDRTSPEIQTKAELNHQIVKAWENFEDDVLYVHMQATRSYSK